jgi:hypothetical protein
MMNNMNIEIYCGTFRQVRQVCELMESLLKASDKPFAGSRSSDQFTLTFDDKTLIFRALPQLQPLRIAGTYGTMITGSF